MDKRELMKERLLASTTTIIIASADIDTEDVSIEVKEVTKEQAARYQLMKVDDTITCIVDIGYKPTEEDKLEGIATARARLNAILHPKFIK